jgi:hypothetical protein
VVGGRRLDTSPIGNNERGPALPLDQQWRISTGLQHDLAPNITVGVCLRVHVRWAGGVRHRTRPPAGRLAGDYDPNVYNFVNATLIWRF